MEDINVWLLPIKEEILVTDQTGGVPVDVCNLPKPYSDKLEKLTGSASVLYRFTGWHEAVKFADNLKKEKLIGWDIQYDNWYGRLIEAEQNQHDE